MRAAYLIAPRRVELREVAVPEPEPGGLVLRVRVALTDGTDLKAFRRGHPRMPMPTRFGHEFSGDVAAVGAGVNGFAAGDALATVHSAPCGECFWCARNQEELCTRVMDTMVLGAYAEYVAIPPHIVARNAFRKPPRLSYEAAAFLEPLSCVVHALDLLAPPRGSQVLVIGDGAFGILHGAVARTRFGCRAILVGHHTERMALARAFGFEETIDSLGLDDDGIRSAVQRVTGGRGADAVVECTGSQPVWEAAPGYARRGGTVLLFGGLPSGARPSFDAFRLHYDEVRLISPFHFTPRAVRVAYDILTTGAIDVMPLVSARYSLSDLPLAFEDLENGRGLKFAIVP